MNEHAGFLKGLKVAEARERMIQRLKEEGLLVKQKKIMHRTPICERSKDAIEFIVMPEFYLKQVEFKDKMRELADKMNFFAPESRQILLNWIGSISIDWPISRRRYYATEIPLWHCESCGKVILPPKGRYYQPWREKSPIKRCPKCGGNEFKGEERVFDTWFDSSITPLYILKYSRNNEFFEKNSPCSLRPQGKEIVRTWLCYTVLKDYLLTGKCIFKDVWINFHIVDENGHKMSKSRGNVIDPKDILDKFGAEPFRLWAAIEGNLAKTDFRCSFERIEGAGKTITKLWNVARFISMFSKAEGKFELTMLDKWIIQEVNELIKLARQNYEEYNFHAPAILMRHFIWETFASHYLELVKNRAYNGEKNFSQAKQNGALYALHYCLDIILRLLAPIIPLMTCKIYKELYNKDVHFLEFPKVEKEFEVGFSTSEIIELNSQIWKAKKERGMSLKNEIKEATLPRKFKEIGQDLVEMHRIKRVKYGEKLDIVF
jgi:valyl-tRNA synthetase